MNQLRRWQILTAFTALFVVGSVLSAREEATPERLSFSVFPTVVSGYTSSPLPVSNEALRKLQLTDHLSRVYANDGQRIAVYIGYHGLQRQGSNIHSPLHCLPGGGWTVLEKTRVPLPGHPDGPQVNRLIIGYGENRQLLYYWYQGRNRVIADEFKAILFQLRDIAVLNRSDAALVRFSIAGADSQQEETLRAFIRELIPILSGYIPA